MPRDTFVETIEKLIAERHATRAFLPKPVARETIERVLQVAARAPSGANLQPWKVHVLRGEAKQRLEQCMLATLEDPDQRALLREEYAYYPSVWREPYQSRRRKVGLDLYQLLGIAKGDTARTIAQLRRNHVFFGAPVALLFSIDRDLGLGSWLDYGMFLQTLMIAARAHGLETCPQAAHNQFHRLIAEEVGLAPTEQFVCGMALGYGARLRRSARDREPTPDRPRARERFCTICRITQIEPPNVAAQVPGAINFGLSAAF